MPRHKSLEGAYHDCERDGCIRELSEVNEQRVRTCVRNANVYLSAANIVDKSIERGDDEWMAVYVMHYEALRMFSEALLRLAGKKATNHRCLFASLLTLYPGLELEWDFFEKIRTKRNGTHYYGEEIRYEDWRDVQLQMDLYEKTLGETIDRRLTE